MQMTYIVSLTSQGQISIPAALRHKLGFDKRGKVLVIEEAGKLTIKPAWDLLDLKGSLKTNRKPLSSSKMREMFAEYMAREAVGEEI